MGGVGLFNAPAAAQSPANQWPANIVCQLAVPVVPYVPQLDAPPTPLAAKIAGDVYAALCPLGCGHVELYQNATASNAHTQVVPGLGSRVTER
jgi:hypothetical protein